MKFSTVAILMSTAVAFVSADVQGYYQCGGTNYSGETTCVTGFTCKDWNEFYSQCIPGTNAGSSTAVVPASSATSKASACGAPKPTTTSTAPGSPAATTTSISSSVAATSTATSLNFTSTASTTAVATTASTTASTTAAASPTSTPTNCVKRRGNTHIYRYRRALPIHPAH